MLYINWWASISRKKFCLVLCFHILFTCLLAAYLRVHGGYIPGALFNFWQIFHVLKFSVLCDLVYSDSSWLDSTHFMLLCGSFWYIFHNAVFSHTFCVYSLYVRWKIQARHWLYAADLVCSGSSTSFASMKLQEIHGIRHWLQQLVLTPNCVSEWSDTPACCKSLWSPECCITAAG